MDENTEETNTTRSLWDFLSHPITVTILGWLIVVVIGLLFTDLYNSAKQTLFPPPIMPAFISLSPEEVAVSLEGIRNKFDLDDIARSKYYGKCVRWKGRINENSPASNDLAKFTLVFEYANNKDDKVFVTAYFAKDNVRHLEQGNEFSILGMISSVSSLTVPPQLTVVMLPQP